jgi:hypothetical protein
MKTRYSILISSLLLASMISWTACSKNNEGMSTRSNLYTISGNAEGAQVVPAIGGPGSATIAGTYNPTSRLLSYSSTWTGLSGAPSSAAFYAGGTGVNGIAASMPWAITGDATTSGTINGSLYLTSEQATELTSGGWYYLFGTATNPDGEVRGQISASQE